MKLATLCYVRFNGSTLMLHRVKRQSDVHAGKWNGLGGKLEPGESPEACVIREVHEESGLRIFSPEWRGILTFPSFYDDEDWYAFVFVARDFVGELIESREGVLEWVENERLLDLNLWPGDRMFIPWLENNAFFSGRFFYNDGVLDGYEAHFYSPGQISRDTQVIHEGNDPPR